MNGEQNDAVEVVEIKEEVVEIKEEVVGIPLHEEVVEIKEEVVEIPLHEEVVETLGGHDPTVSHSKKRRWRSGTVAKREIAKLQKGVRTVIPREPFLRLVREVAGDNGWSGRFTSTAIDALQEAVEAKLVEQFAAGDRLREMTGRKTLHTQDISQPCT
jgi:histone H3/H4